MDTPPVPDWLRNANLAFGAPPPEPGNWLTAGLSSGFHGLLSDIGSLGQGIGSATGWQGLQQAGQGFAQSQQAQEQAAENPYYEQHPWSLGGLGYKVAQTVTGLAPALAGTAAANFIPGVGEAVDASWLARLGSKLPRLLGGGAGLGEEAAAVAGKQLARGVVGGGVGMFPQIAGGNIQAEQGGDTSQPVSRGQALAALAVGAPEAALGGLFPESLFGGSGGAGLGSKILRGAMTGAAVNAVNSGLQTGLNQFLSDTDKPIGERASDIVQSALQGGVIGGILGGATHGVSALFRPDTPPASVTTPGMESAVDEVVNPKQLTYQPSEPPPQTPAEMPSADLQAQFASLDPDKSQGEAAQHLLYGEEIARRTQPGLTPGDGVLMEPNEVAARAPLIEAMQAQLPPEVAKLDDPFVQNFSAASEPELVNALQKRLADGSAPQAIVDLAKDKGIASDGKLMDLVPKAQDAFEKYEAAVKDGDTEKAAPLGTKFDDIVKLAETHGQAADLLAAVKGVNLGTGPHSALADNDNLSKTLSSQDAVDRIRGAIEYQQGLVDGSITHADKMLTAVAKQRAPAVIAQLREQLGRLGRLTDAVREPSAASVDVLPASRDGNTERTTPSESGGQAQEAVGDAPVHQTPAGASGGLVQAPAKEFLTPVSKRGVQVEPAPAPAPSLEDRIRSAHAALSGGDPTRSIQLKDMRAQLPDVPKDVLDKELVRLHEEPDNGIEMGMSSNGPARTAENLLGGIAYKGDIVHEMTASPRLIESGSVKERIADAFDQLAALKGPGMQRLNDLRSMVPDVSRTNFDKALLDGFKDRSVNLMGFDNPRDIQAVGDAKLQYGRTADQVAHVVNIEDRAKFTGRPQTIPPSDDPITDLRQMYQTETDPDRKMYAAAALATGDPEKASAVLQALQMAKGFFSNEAGSLNLGALGQAFNKLTGKVKKGIADDLSRPQTEATKPEDMIENQAARTPGQMEGRAKAFNAFSDLVVNDQMVKVVKAGDTANRAIRKQLQPALGGSQIAQFVGKNLRSATGWMARLETNAAIERAVNLPDALNAMSYTRAEKALKTQADRMLEMLNDGSGIDFRKKWSDHSEAMRTGSNANALMAKHKTGAAEWSRMQQNGSAKLVNNILGLNMTKGYQAVGANLQKWREALAPKGMKSVLPNPHEAAQFDDVRHDDPVDNYRKSRDAAWGLFKEIKDFVASQDDLGQQAKPVEAKTILAGLEGVRSALRANEARLNQIAEGTYSPLSHGRGEHFVAGKIAVDDAGRPLPKAVAAIRNAMDESGFGDVGMFHDAENNSIMTRLDKASRMEDLERIFNEMEERGHMLPGETRSGYAKDPAKMARIVPAHIQALFTELSDAIDKSDTIDPAQRDEIKATMRMHLMDTLPDHNMALSDQERTHAQGFDTKMGDVAIQRALDGSRSSTAIAMSGKTAEARQAMSNEVKAAQNDPSLRPQERLIGADAQREYAIREGADPWYAKNSIFDVLRSGTQALEVGTRLPYALTMASQIFTLSHGELAKIYGHVRAAKALAASASDAFKALKVMFTGVGRMTLDLRRTELEAAGNISQKSIDTLMHLANAGKLTTFNQSMAALGAGESGGAIPSVRKTLEIANLWGSYMEMYPRLITGLAAAKLHDERFGDKSNQKGQSKQDYAGEMVSNSQFDWGPGEASRLTSAKGPLGPFGKFAFAFTRFRTNVTMKLITEFHDLRSGTPAERQEAGRFLASHLIATTVLAGTLGLPGADMFAGIFDKLYATLTGKDDMDIEGLYRTWMANAYGPGVSEVLAKGLPRALGIDLSHLGEQDLIPFTEAVKEKRKFEDAADDWIQHMAGPTINEAKDMVVGLRDIVNGDYSIGMEKALPGSLKEFVGAYRLNEIGHYVDNQGRALPITPGALSVLQEALGVKPANEAQYQEASEIKQGLLAQRLYRQQNIGTHLLRAFNTGDTASIAPWMREAVQYQMDHPGLGGPMQNLQRMIMMSQRGQAQAQALGIPLGVKPQDVGLQSRLGFLGQ